MSHFVLDKIPHFAVDDDKKNSSSAYKLVVFSDVLIAIALTFALFWFQKWSMAAAAAAAYSPDASLVFYYFRHNRDFNISPKNGFMKFHLAMQYERPWGIISELIVAVALLPFFIHYLVK